MDDIKEAIQRASKNLEKSVAKITEEVSIVMDLNTKMIRMGVSAFKGKLDSDLSKMQTGTDHPKN